MFSTILLNLVSYFPLILPVFLQILRRDEGIECSDFGSILSGEEGEVDLNAGYIQHCIIDQGFDEIKKYDSFRYTYMQYVRVHMSYDIVQWNP